MISVAALITGGVIGPVVASYATTAALRATDAAAPRGGRSLCDGCRRTLSWAESVPIASYVVLKGRCRTCAAPISSAHPIGEVIGLMAGLAIALAAPDYRALALGGLAATLLAAAVVDYRTRKLPNQLTVIVAVLGALLSAHRGLDASVEGLVAALISMALVGGLAVAYRRRRGQVGIGQGDVKLFAALALWLGAATSWLVFSAAALALSVVAFARPADRRVAMGPPIALAGFTIGLLLEAGKWPGP